MQKRRSSRKKELSFDPVSRGAKPGIDHRAIFKERVLAISKDSRVAVLHDTDSDGLCSAVIVAKGIERLRGKPVDFILHQPHKEIGLTKDTIDSLAKKKIDILFVTDKAIDQTQETVRQASLYFKVIALDHHQVEADLSDEMILILKAQFISLLDGARYPTSKMAFDLFSELTDISDLDWLCAAGVIADACYPSWKPFVDGTLKARKLAIKDDVFETDLGLISRCIGNTILYDQRKVKEALAILMEAKDPKDVLHSRLKEYSDAVEREINYWIDEHNTRAAFVPELELIFYVVSPKYPINSPLSTIISKKLYPNRTVVVVHDSGDPILGISLRRQDYCIHCPNLVKAAVSGLQDAGGGGHIPAAGGKIRRQDLSRFLEKLKEELASGRHRLDPKQAGDMAGVNKKGVRAGSFKENTNPQEGGKVKTKTP